MSGVRRGRGPLSLGQALPPPFHVACVGGDASPYEDHAAAGQDAPLPTRVGRVGSTRVGRRLHGTPAGFVSALRAGVVGGAACASRTASARQQLDECITSRSGGGRVQGRLGVTARPCTTDRSGRDCALARRSEPEARRRLLTNERVATGALRLCPRL